jgi:hypothetical protein
MVAKLAAAIHRMNMIALVNMEQVTGAQHHPCFVILVVARRQIVGQYGYVLPYETVQKLPISVPWIDPGCEPKR